MSTSWIIFAVIISLLLILDLGIFHKKNDAIKLSESIISTIGYFIIAVIFGVFILYHDGIQSSQEYFAGYILEKSLSLDNIMVISLIFSSFKVHPKLQHRVLFWGILGVIVMRGILIYLGDYIVQSFSWVLYIFGFFLIITGSKLLFTSNKAPDIHQTWLLKFLYSKFTVVDEINNEKFFIKSGQKWCITPLFVCLCIIEFMDLIFAIDSIPAIFSITTNAYIVYTSNIFAILGLRSLYFVLAHMIERFHYIKYSLAVMLIFIGSKVFIAHLYHEISITITLSITIAILACGVIASIYATSTKR